MNSRTMPDRGIVKALALKNLPKGGLAYELGFGTARNLFAMAQLFPGRTIGYELDHSFLEKAREAIKKKRIRAEVLRADVLGIDWKPNTVSIVSIATTIYWPKSVVHKFLEQMWQSLHCFGVIHMEFPTPEDCTYESPFVEYTCLPYPESGYDHSFGHYCGFPCMRDHPGVIGVSYWAEPEVLQAFSNLGKMRVVHKHLRQWHQKNIYYEGDEGVEQETLYRSFYTVTVQKLS